MVGGCSLQGCRKRKWTEPRTGIVHDYCGRTHAEIALRGKVPPPHGSCHTCNYTGCSLPVFFEEGRVHDFCCRSHARSAMDEGMWPKSLRSSQGQATPTNKCSLPGCSAPCYREPQTGNTLDFCGRSHAQRAKAAGMQGRSEALQPDHAEIVFSGTTQDGNRYSISMMNKSHPKYDGLKDQFQKSWRHDTPVPTVVR